MSISKRLRFKVLERDGFRCRYCGATASDERLEVDHVVARSIGGPDIMANLVTSCYSCNHGKKHHALPVAELKRLVRENAQPVEIGGGYVTFHKTPRGMASLGEVLRRSVELRPN